MAIYLDRAALRKLLEQECAPAVNELAHAIAAKVDVGSVTEAEVTVREYTTDRHAAAVSIAHPAGLAIQAKHGALTKAAAAVGVTVHPMKGKP